MLQKSEKFAKDAANRPQRLERHLTLASLGSQAATRDRYKILGQLVNWQIGANLVICKVEQICKFEQIHLQKRGFTILSLELDAAQDKIHWLLVVL